MTSLRVLLAIKRNLFYVVGRAGLEFLPNGAEATSSNSEPQKIVPSFSEASEFAGHVDVASPHEISGWLSRPKKSTAPCTVVLNLNDFSLVPIATSIHRPDLDKKCGSRNRAGFRIELTSDNFRSRIAAAITKLSNVDQANCKEGLSKIATLTAWAIDEDALEIAPVFEHYLPLPEQFEATRTLADWLDYFDISPEEVVASQSSVNDWPPLFPTVDYAAPCSPKVVAFYLPQFHPIEENDEWWGPGYTEWIGVATSKPNFSDHAAPNVPADLGFYDLRIPDVRKRQGELAREYGIYGFCYYFYWFSGRRILETPLDLMLADGEPDIPFCLCWANEPWSRRWDGSDQEVLLEQKHDLEGDLKIIDDLMPYFEDHRYIRVDGKPVLLIYRAGLMKDAFAFTRRLRSEAVKRGLPGLHLCNAMTFGQSDLSFAGFDAAVEFPPHNIVVKEVDRTKVKVPAAFEGKIYDYADLVSRQLVASPSGFPHYPGVMPRWDNTARRPMKGHVYHGATPELFELWLRCAARRTLQANSSAPLVFINSWNEWSEGAHLEPDRRFGRGFLEAIRRIAAGEPNVADDTSPLAATLSSLMIENKLLSERVREIGLLTSPSKILPGLPTMATKPRSRNAGKCHIDYVNGRVSHGRIIVRQGVPLVMRGWLLGNLKEGGRVEDFAYFVLTRNGEDTSYYVPIFERQNRTDVLEHFKIKSDHAFIGFTARIGIGSLPGGLYKGSFIDVKSSGEYHVEVKDGFEII